MGTKGISELVLAVEDVLETARFYREVIGLEVERSADESWAWFWTGEAGNSPRLALHKGRFLFGEHSPHPEGERWGPVHFALEVDREELEAAVAHVRERGVEVYGPTYFEWMEATSYYCYDPAGNLVEFWSPGPPSGEGKEG